MRPAAILFMLLASCVAALGLNLSVGPDGVDALGTWEGLTGQGDVLTVQLVRELRLPRAMMALACGASLAVVGALLQALLRNPLADPYVLGVSGGAGAAALAAMLLGSGTLGLVLGGFAGAGASLALILALGYRGGFLPARLLLAGVILSAAWGALTTLLLALAPDAPLRGMVFWLMGDLTAPESAWPVSALAAGLLLAIWPLARTLDALARGELSAAALGVSVARTRAVVLFICAVATAAVVVSAGSIGFVGLVTPHLVRLAGARRHGLLLPAAWLGGATLLLLADVAARALLAPRQLPVGAITALIGAPLFLYLLLRDSRRP